MGFGYRMTSLVLEHVGCAQYVTMQKYSAHLSLVIFFFPTPPIKLKLVLQIGGRLLIASQLYRSETGSSNQIIFITPFSGKCSALLWLLTSLSKLCKNVAPKPFCYAELPSFDLFHLILICRVTYWAPMELLLGLKVATINFDLANYVVLKNEELKCFHSSWNCYVCQRQNNDCLVIDEGETFLVSWRHRMWDDCVSWSCSVS